MKLIFDIKSIKKLKISKLKFAKLYNVVLTPSFHETDGVNYEKTKYLCKCIYSLQIK